MTKNMRVGIDLSKNVFVVYGVDERDRCVVKRTLKRAELLLFFAQLEACLIGMEAGSGAHHWARELIKLGHDARIMDPRLVAPYRNQGRTGKNDANDAEAICEAVGRPHMRFVPIKDPEQQAILLIHRVRKAIVNEQNRVANQLRGLLAEFGVVMPRTAITQTSVVKHTAALRRFSTDAGLGRARQAVRASRPAPSADTELRILSS